MWNAFDMCMAGSMAGCLIGLLFSVGALICLMLGVRP